MNKIFARVLVVPAMAFLLVAGTVVPSGAATGWDIDAPYGIQRSDSMQPSDSSQTISTRAKGRAKAAESRQQVVVGFAPGTSANSRALVARQAGGRLLKTSRLTDLSLVKVPHGRSVTEMAAALAARPGVVYAEPNYTRTVLAADTQIGKLWGLRNTGQTVNGVTGRNDADMDVRSEAWSRPLQQFVKVAVIDTGVDMEHPDLAGMFWTNTAETINGSDDSDPLGYVDDRFGWDFVDNDNDPDDECQGHGSHVAGTIAAKRNNSLGVAGVLDKVRIMPIRVGLCDGSIDVFSIADAFTYANRMGAKVVNASFGGSGGSLTEQNAIRNAKGTLFVVAAGNENVNVDSLAMYPCDYFSSNILCVAATTQTDGRAAFSNFGRHNVDVGAPGKNILSLDPWDTPAFQDFFTSPDGTTPPSLSQWVTGGSPNTWATGPFSGVNWELREAPGVQLYPNNMDQWIGNATPLDLSTGSDCRFSYYLERYLADTGDSLRLEVFDGANWDPLKTFIGSTGPNDPVVFHTTTIPSEYETSSFQFRWHFVTSSSGVSDGLIIDDVEVECDLAGEDSYVFQDGTSMAAPHAAGAAALLWAFRPSASVISVKNALMLKAERKTALVGKTVTGGRLNANAAMGLLKSNLHPMRTIAKTDRNDTAGSLDVRRVTLGTGDAGVVTKVTLDSRWSSSLLKTKRMSDGLIDIVFDTDVSTDLDYVIRIDYVSGRLRGKVMRCTSSDCSSWTQVGSASVSRPDAKTVQAKVSRSMIRADGSFIFFFAATGWGSARCPTGCFDTAPNNGAIYDL